MRLLPSLLAGIAAACLAIAPALAQGADARVIVKLKPGSPVARSTILSVEQRHASQAEAMGVRIGRTLRGGAAAGEGIQLMTASGISAEALAERIAQEPDVEYAVVDRRRQRSAAPNDPRYGNNLVGITPAAGQWYLRPNNATFVSAINAEQAWDITTGSASVIVAVIDTGIRADHPDLAGKLLPGYDTISDLPTANDGNGPDANPADEGDWLTQTEINNNPGSFDGCSTQATSSWHGTQVAGIVGALTDNNLGMASVGRNVRVLPVRVLGKCGGYDIDIIAGMRWAAGLSVPGLPINPNPANVINMSLGGDSTCSAAYINAINEIHAARPGTVIVASAGNSAGHPVSSPANCPGIVAVGAVRHTGTKVGFSDMGPQVAITAPGGNCVNASGTCLYPILTTTNSGTTTPVSDGAGGSAYSGGGSDATLGTSFSAPLVAGTAGLMLSLQPGLKHTQVTLAMQIGARPFPTSGAGAGVAACPAPLAGVDVLECYCTTSTCGAGLLDAAGAVGVANATQAFFDVAPGAPVATQAITLDAGLSFAAPGRTITGYSWSLVPGIASFASPTNQSTATVVTNASGTFDATLTVFDNLGGQSSETQRITVSAAAGGGGGGGGGALGVPWLVALAMAAWALRRTAPR